MSTSYPTPSSNQSSVRSTAAPADQNSSLEPSPVFGNDEQYALTCQSILDQAAENCENFFRKCEQEYAAIETSEKLGVSPLSDRALKVFADFLGLTAAERATIIVLNNGR